MSRENTYTAIILKKQPFNEADEIVTVYSREAGKLRLLAKSVKSSRSRLQQALQALFVVRLRAAGGRLPKIIGAEVLNSFRYLREDLAAAQRAFYAAELAMKFTGDEHPNELLYKLLNDFLEFLNQAGNRAKAGDFGLAKFKLESLAALGMGVRLPERLGAEELIGFSNQYGGFAPQAAGFSPVRRKVLDLYRQLAQTPFDRLPAAPPDGDLEELQALLSGFVVYQLEREMRSERYLAQEM